MNCSCFLRFAVLFTANLAAGQNPDESKDTSEIPAKVTTLAPVVVKGKKLKEEKFGIKSSFSLMHFVDASTDQKSRFEIAQLIRFDTIRSKITSVNLLINKERSDSGLFKINFYKIIDNKPGEEITGQQILERKAIKKGWLKFDLSGYDIRLKGDFIVGITFLSPVREKEDPIAYEIKLGGRSRSFVRNSADKEWKTPPHHFKLHITALVDTKKYKNKLPDEDAASVPATNLFSGSVNDTFSIFISTPPNYTKNPGKRYPVTYLLDANAYFDILAQQKHQLKDRILVGIGYENAYLMDSLRNRDYTFPVAEKQDSFAVSGGGEKFFRFIKEALIPYIDKNYRTDADNRTLMGHSLGGYFTLFAFHKQSAEQQQLFTKFVAASPTLYYGDGFLQKELEKNTFLISRKIRLTITYGENEFKTDTTLDNYFNSYLKALQRIGNVSTETRIYSKYSHMETAIPTFESAL